MSVDSRALEPDAIYRFQVRLALGAVAPVAPPQRMDDLVAGLRRAGTELAGRAEVAAAVFGRLGERGWRPLTVPPSGREVLAAHGFTGPGGAELPEAVSVVKDATGAEVARDLAAEGDLGAELAASLAVRVDGLDIPAVVGPASIELRFTPREYLETFSIRG